MGRGNNILRKKYGAQSVCLFIFWYPTPIHVRRTLSSPLFIPFPSSFYTFSPICLNKSRKIILDLENVIPFINSNLNDTPKNNFIFLNNSIEYAVSIPVSILETSAWLSALNKINNGCDTESQTPDTFNS